MKHKELVFFWSNFLLGRLLIFAAVLGYYEALPSKRFENSSERDLVFGGGTDGSVALYGNCYSRRGPCASKASHFNNRLSKFSPKPYHHPIRTMNFFATPIAHALPYRYFL